MNPTRKKHNKKTVPSIVGVFLLLIFGLGFYGVLVEPYQVEIRHVWLDDSKLSKILAGKIAVQLSDLHMDEIGRREKKVISIVEGLKPSFIFLTGDYVSRKGNYEAALDFLSKLKAKIGVWAVMGDYDYSLPRMSCLFCHKQGTGEPSHRHEVRFLRNVIEKVNIGDGLIWIGGLSPEAKDPSSYQKIFLRRKSKGPTIILSHNPLNFELLDGAQEALMLSGNTHGGQIPLPSWLWRLLGYEKCARYSQGLFEKGRKKMFVSRGLGTSHLPLRILRRPEVVVLHFGSNST